MSYFMEMVKKGAEAVKKNPRTCDMCGIKETLDNVILKYRDPETDEVIALCDDCMMRKFPDPTF